MQENLESALRSFARRKPFRPFFIEFHTGERLLVKHPEAVAPHVNLLVHVDATLRYRLFDSSSVNQLLDPPEP